MASRAYYNEIDPYAAQWLRNLIAAGHIAPGDVDERSIEDVNPDDLRGYTQCHFFAGIGVWSRALRLAGWPDSRPVWTGSCPCQPFSTAGKSGGFDDERHLWPAFHHLIAERRPPVVFGEQVASKDGLAWLDLVQADLEGADYASAAVDLCAAGVGAPHIRQRLFWVADSDDTRREGWLPRGQNTQRVDQHGHTGCDSATDRLADAQVLRREGRDIRTEGGLPPLRATDIGEPNGLGHANSAGQQARDLEPFGDEARPKQFARTSSHSGLADTDAQRHKEQVLLVRQRADELQAGSFSDPRPVPQQGYDACRSSSTNGQWRDADWLFCRDGKWRPVEPGTFPLAHGATSRVGRLRAYGNAIVPQVAAEVINAYMWAVAEAADLV